MAQTHTLPAESNVVLLVSRGVPDTVRGAITMPDVLGKSIGAIVGPLERQGVTVQVAADYTDKVPVNRVFAQFPAPGERAMVGSIVVVLISRGRRRHKATELGVLPNVVGQNSYDAEDEIRRSGLTPILVETYHPSAPGGEVVGQLPNLKSVQLVPNVLWIRTRMLLPVAAILLVALGLFWFFLGPAIVPDVRGQQLATARANLSRAGLVPGSVAVTGAPGVKDGIVLAQIPAFGAPMRRGDTVNLLISGPKPQVMVPDLIKSTRLQIGFSLQSVGLRAQIVETASASIDQGLVIRTEPPAGEVVDPGTTVKVFISTGKP
jgi:beta-lactam-binding protein with PASTA domain